MPSRQLTDLTLPKFPDIRVQLMGCDHGAYGPLAQCLAAMVRAGLSPVEQNQFTREATTGDYADLLRVCAAWLVVVD